MCKRCEWALMKSQKQGFWVKTRISYRRSVWFLDFSPFPSSNLRFVCRPNFIVESVERHCITYGHVCRRCSSIIFVSQVNPQCHKTETDISIRTINFISGLAVTCCRNKKLELLDSKQQQIEVYEPEFVKPCGWVFLYTLVHSHVFLCGSN